MEILTYLHAAQQAEEGGDNQTFELIDDADRLTCNWLWGSRVLAIGLMGGVGLAGSGVGYAAAPTAVFERVQASYAGGDYFFVQSLGGELIQRTSCGTTCPEPTPIVNPTPEPLPVIVLRCGDSNSAVAQLQDYLRALGYFTGQSTGYFGEHTQSAVIAFQQDYGLLADGVVGQQTWSALQSQG